ncbi:UDP-N-acetylglucosamine--N-acetylmuramyl-(pentapeptide) pyrophosphoryl-undecaprenol N-acetylglucosamine transferase [Falsarthrobacter nasiphocae]|uniref:UDP-N-acetylglucosamine--N-acetylmuramyl-(pentapeptide) pyrophosphoryl-undecaprenol N-acetylglucosamine transferase n=1 Tax=Falsarthrobacter nasiphocae TaxID=189863 RepID=A0AAE3YCD5_9MICC|nr:UDP-N-acetylglucosamine--N-acetylmuramyl-(pentapeptide) pyrophosphoryl-undecaprenol N-acetylglucosamine transferase [Falsarthrobacter nasiphocae]MDR6891318.1 UDP-N-acetylglucosamine--N-acetylmuramyl-(pentapeptide) pyrophosphoryl-undecaprenol N-acetylglucosamine transferase [Falsarthrobacter nasiphocae]
MSTEPSPQNPAALSAVFAGGGTAGHISPMIAIADALLERLPGARVTMVGTPSGMETRLVPAAGYELKTIDRVPMPRRPSADLVRLPGRFARAVRQAEAILDEADADVLVGVGGYVCTPMYAAARRRGVPIVIHEANAKPGLANRVGSALGGSVAVAFASTPLRGAAHVGMPMRRAVSELDRAAARDGAREALGVPGDAPLVVVTGGSSGAASINGAVGRFVAGGGLAGTGVRILHITGRGKTVTGPDGAPLAGEGYVQREYVDGMELAYAAADLVVARSGAGTVCELAATGTPALLVPLPHGNGEQALNAADLVRAGGAILTEDSDFTEGLIRSTVLPLVQDPAALARMSEAASRVGVRDADRRMADRAIAAASNRKDA